MNDKYWYAVLMDADDNDWGTGSFSLAEAWKKAAPYPDARIAVIDGKYNDDGNPTADPICVDILYR